MRLRLKLTDRLAPDKDPSPKWSRRRSWPLVLCVFLAFAGGSMLAGGKGRDFSKPAMTVRANTLRRISPKVIMHPTITGVAGVRPSPGLIVAGLYPWKYNIVTTVFWI